MNNSLMDHINENNFKDDTHILKKEEEKWMIKVIQTR